MGDELKRVPAREDDGSTNPAPLPTRPPPPIAFSEHGLQIKTIDELWRFSSILAKSRLLPKGIQTTEEAFICIQLGAELGLPPMQSVQGIAPINGIPQPYGDTQLAVCMASNVFDHESFEEVEVGASGSDEWGFECTVRRKNGRLVQHVFTVADAKKAGLWGKKGPWQEYPRRMLQMRARGFALRDAFADVLKGTISVEEARDVRPLETIEAKQITKGGLEDFARGVVGAVVSTSEADTAGDQAAAETASDGVASAVESKDGRLFNGSGGGHEV